MGRVNVADFKARTLARQTTRPKRRHAALVGDFRQRIGLIHELRQLAGAEEFTHRGHGGLGVDQVVGHHGRYVDARHALLDGALHAQQPDAILVFQQFADRTDTTVAQVIDIVDFALAVLQVHQFLDDGQNVLGPQRGDGVLCVQVKTHVQLDAADRRQVVALRIEEQAGEQRFRRFLRRRLAGAHDAINVAQRLIAFLGLVGLERIADPRAGADMVDVEQFEAVDARLVQLFQIFGRNFVTGLDVDFAGAFVDQVIGAVAAIDFLGRDQQRGQAVLFRLVGGAGADLVTGGEHDFARIAIDNVKGRLQAAPGFGQIGNLPAAFAAHEGHLVVEVTQNFLGGQAQRIEQRRDRQLALAVDADVDDVLGVELEVQPRTAIGDDARGEQIFARRMGLAPVMIEQHARRPVHLADDDALGAVDDEGAVARHQGHVAHIDVLLLDIEHRTGFGVLIHFEHDQAQGNAHRRCIGDAALTAFLGVVFRVFQLVMDEIHFGGAGEIADREHAAQRLFQPRHIADRRVRPQELFIAFALNLNQVRHLHHFVDVAEHLSDALLRAGVADGGSLGRHALSLPSFVAYFSHRSENSA